MTPGEKAACAATMAFASTITKTTLDSLARVLTRSQYSRLLEMLEALTEMSENEMPEIGSALAPKACCAACAAKAGH